MTATPSATPGDPLWLVLDDVHPALLARGLALGARWPVPPGARLSVGLRPTDHILLPRVREALLGGQTAYVLVRRDDRLEVQHTGHIGHFRLGGRLHNSTRHPPPTLAPGEAVELLTVDGELALCLRLERPAD